MSRTDVHYLEWSACPRHQACSLDTGHAGDCDLLPRWPGLPDPHRHNPFGVAVVVGAFGVAWVAVVAVVVLMIAGVLP